jgi:putative hydrolase of the HAD superfamily
MLSPPVITTLFLDIGGVLLSNGWDRHVRRRAAEQFDLDYDEMNERHHLIFDGYEKGRLDLEGYLEQVVFHRERPFTREEFRAFMFDQSQPCPDMLDLIRRLKARYPLKTVAVSNEGRELNAYRIRKFALTEVLDFFVSSCYVHKRKPDRDIYLMAMDMAQVAPHQVAYFDDREMFVDVAASLGILGRHHTSAAGTLADLLELGFSFD